jgi:hypothetical protein
MERRTRLRSAGPADPIGMNGSVQLSSGKLASASRLSGVALRRFVAAVNAAPPAAACATREAPFAVLFPPGGTGPNLMVELGGCHRMDDGAGNLRQLDAATVALLVS